MSSFTFHYNQFKQAGLKLADREGLTVEDFKRCDDIREASATAIAIEEGIIELIPSDGRLDSTKFREVQLLIRRYELHELERQGFFSNLTKGVKCQCNECNFDEFFTCQLCEREVPYCFGASDEFEDLCDDCAVRQMNYQEYLAAM